MKVSDWTNITQNDLTVMRRKCDAVLGTEILDVCKLESYFEGGSEEHPTSAWVEMSTGAAE